MSNDTGRRQASTLSAVARQLVGWRQGRGQVFWTMVTAISMIAILLPVVVARPAFGATLPEGTVDWEAAQRLAPLEGPGGSAPGLLTEHVEPLVCSDDGACLAVTTRPELEATIDPDPHTGYSFVVYDLSGSGGLAVAAASVHGHDSPRWAPAAGLLQHGHVYAWTVAGDPDESQDWGVFAVDVQRSVEQAFDGVGPFSVAMSTGELVVDHPLGSPEDDYPLAVQHRGTDAAGREAGSTPLQVVSDGWALSGSGLGEASWHALDAYADGETIVAQAVDGTSLRYDRDADGDYQPPEIDGLDLSFMYPVLEARPDGGFVVSEPDGSISTFSSVGMLESFELPAREGGAAIHLDVVWAGGLLREVTDPLTGRTATFNYLDDRECRPGPGFDTGSPVPALCGVTTFSGETIQLWYLNGALSRIVGAGGAVTDFAYDDSGNLTTVRESLAADAVAAGVVADDETVTWRIEYDGEGRVASVTSPEPLPGADRTVRTYGYASGVTTIAENGVERGTVSFDPADYRVLQMRAAEADAPFVRLYDDDRNPIGFVDERGLQISWATDPAGNIVESWGPAPQGWFGPDGRPLAAYTDQVATATTTHGAGAGMLAIYTDGTAVDGTQSAQSLLTSGSIESLPGAVDASGGWRLTAIGDVLLPLEGDVGWRFATDDAADPTATLLLVNNVPVATGESVEIPGPEEIDEDGQPFELWVVYVSDTAPAPGSPAWFTIEYDAGEGWVTLDPAEMLGQDQPSATTSIDVYGAGQTPTRATTSMTYADPLLGLVGSYDTQGATTTVGYEPANPLAGQYARTLEFTNQGGVSSAISYWDAHDTVAHPITGESLPQYGRFKSVQTGSDAARGMIYDAAGRVVAYTADGAVTSAVTYDTRERVASVELRDDPPRSIEYRFGVGGDPRVTGATSAIGGETLTAVTTVDLLGRVVDEVDVWGTTTTTSYDAVGSVTSVVVETADGATSTTSYTVDPADRQVRQVSVVAADGATYTASVIGYDQAGRVTGVEYSNGTAVSVDYDPVTGMVSAHRWTDGNGDAWVDEVSRTTQTGRILRHTLDDPTGSAHYDYTYDPSTGALTGAALTGTGTGPPSTSWAYSYDAGARTQRVATTADVTTTLDYTYDGTQAPVAVAETSVASDGEATVRDIPMAFDGSDLVTFDAVQLTYDAEGLLVQAADADTAIELIRDAGGTVLGQRITTGESTTTYHYSGPFVLNDAGTTLAQIVALPGGTSAVAPVDGDVTWHVATVSGDPWWSTDAGGAPVGQATHFSPDGERLTGADDDPTAIDAANGWRSGHGGVTLALDTSVTVFGARAYVPTLGMFTTTDPIPGAGPTPYSYADNDPVNLVDPTGNSSEGPFDNWNSWGSQLAIVIGLSILAILLVMAGQPHGAVAMMLVLAGYLGALSVDSFIQGDIAGGILYAIAAVLVLAGGVKLGVKASAMRTKLAPKTSISQSFVSTRSPTLTMSPTHSLSASQSLKLPPAAHYAHVLQQQHAQAYAHVMAASGGVGAGAGAASLPLATKAALYIGASGVFFKLGFVTTTPEQW